MSIRIQLSAVSSHLEPRSIPLLPQYAECSSLTFQEWNINKYTHTIVEVPLTHYSFQLRKYIVKTPFKETAFIAVQDVYFYKITFKPILFLLWEYDCGFKKYTLLLYLLRTPTITFLSLNSRFAYMPGLLYLLQEVFHYKFNITITLILYNIKCKRRKQTLPAVAGRGILFEITLRSQSWRPPVIKETMVRFLVYPHLIIDYLINNNNNTGGLISYSFGEIRELLYPLSSFYFYFFAALWSYFHSPPIFLFQ